MFLPNITPLAATAAQAAHIVRKVDALPHQRVSYSWFAEATMLADGTIVVNLNEHLLNGTVNEGLIRYKPGSRGYVETLRHVGGLKLGQTKSVPPWGPPR